MEIVSYRLNEWKNWYREDMSHSNNKVYFIQSFGAFKLKFQKVQVSGK